MTIFTIEGQRIEANSKQGALAIFARGLTITEEEEDYPEPLKSLDLEEWIKDGIVSEGDEDNLNSSFCAISTTDDQEVSVATFTSKEKMEKRLKSDFEDPDGSNWVLNCVVMEGKVYHVKPTVTLEYTEKKK